MQYLEKEEIKEIQLALLDYIDAVMEPCLELSATKV